MKFKRFKIVSLFGRFDVDFPIRKNRVVIVGYNGVGKSTILNAFYYLISCQWQKLDEIHFKSIELTLLNRKQIKISKNEISEYCRRPARGRHFSSVHLEEILSWPFDEIHGFAYSAISRASETLRSKLYRRFPASVVREIQFNIRDIIGEHSESENGISNIQSIQKYISAELNGRILYLPTYRRIEKDIKTVFPEIESDLQAAIKRRLKGSGGTEVFVELVNFGMEDVKAKINDKLEQLRFRALSEVNSLTTKYLRDVIRNEANTYSADLATKINRSSIDSIFRKVDEEILNEADRNNINIVIEKIKNGSILRENEEYVAHYVSYLIDISERIALYEKPMRDFVTICNSYLFGKRFVFDNAEYQFRIEYNSIESSKEVGDRENNNINMEDLSSGEKQIVSLFSHLTLDEKQRNYIIIDEPELSLSVDWQQRFLADIARTDGCEFLGAVTHSPFIFDNELDSCAIDIIKYMRGHDELY